MDKVILTRNDRVVELAPIEWEALLNAFDFTLSVTRRKRNGARRSTNLDKVLTPIREKLSVLEGTDDSSNIEIQDVQA